MRSRVVWSDFFIVFRVSEDFKPAIRLAPAPPLISFRQWRLILDIHPVRFVFSKAPDIKEFSVTHPSLSAKSIIVTGAASGIGKSASILLAQRGALTAQ